jgi:hypothetical protein
MGDIADLLDVFDFNDAWLLNVAVDEGQITLVVDAMHIASARASESRSYNVIRLTAERLVSAAISLNIPVWASESDDICGIDSLEISKYNEATTIKIDMEYGKIDLVARSVRYELR